MSEEGQVRPLCDCGHPRADHDRVDEVERLRGELWRCYVESGADPDGSDARHLNPGEAAQAVAELARSYRDSLDETEAAESKLEAICEGKPYPDCRSSVMTNMWTPRGEPQDQADAEHLERCSRCRGNPMYCNRAGCPRLRERLAEAERVRAYEEGLRYHITTLEGWIEDTKAGTFNGYDHIPDFALESARDGLVRLLSQHKGSEDE